MPLFYDKEVKVFKTSCGPYDNNAYLIVCPQTQESIIIDAGSSCGDLEVGTEVCEAQAYRAGILSLQCRGKQGHAAAQQDAQ